MGQNVNPARHPNLAAAQNLCRDAYEKLVAAQKANEYDMSGHAQKAKVHLEQTNGEIKLAAVGGRQIIAAGPPVGFPGPSTRIELRHLRASRRL